jgi:jumonji domain-containing protein 2
VIPPPEYVPRKGGYDINKINMSIPSPICQVVTGKVGMYQQINVQKEPMTIQDFKKLAESKK